eukprot:9821-Heterococcus_DN1.PRE.3
MTGFSTSTATLCYPTDLPKRQLFSLAPQLQTPSQIEGPFYPVKKPVDRDNDLIHVKGKNGTAAGIPLLHYSERPRHIHVKVKVQKVYVLTTQIYFPLDELLDGDPFFKQAPIEARDQLIITPLKNATASSAEIAEHVIILPLPQEHGTDSTEVESDCSSTSCSSCSHTSFGGSSSDWLYEAKQ